MVDMWCRQVINNAGDTLHWRGPVTMAGSESGSRLRSTASSSPELIVRSQSCRFTLLPLLAGTGLRDSNDTLSRGRCHQCQVARRTR